MAKEQKWIAKRLGTMGMRTRKKDKLRLETMAIVLGRANPLSEIQPKEILPIRSAAEKIVMTKIAWLLIAIPFFIVTSTIVMR